jgi:nucleoside-diphosphate-sugar epimerase
VHGSGDAQVNDLTPVGCEAAPMKPPRLVAWRTILEQEVIAASETLDTVVIRPALVYGRENAIWSSLFTPFLSAIDKQLISFNVEPESRPALCHVDDIASGMHAAIDKLPLIAGTGVYPVFDLITSQESMRDILTAAGKALGYRGKIELKGAGDDLFLEAMSVTTNGNSGRAIELLGWQPKRYGYVQHMDRIAAAWAVSQVV